MGLSHHRFDLHGFRLYGDIHPTLFRLHRRFLWPAQSLRVRVGAGGVGISSLLLGVIARAALFFLWPWGGRSWRPLRSLHRERHQMVPGQAGVRDGPGGVRVRGRNRHFQLDDPGIARGQWFSDDPPIPGVLDAGGVGSGFVLLQISSTAMDASVQRGRQKEHEPIGRIQARGHDGHLPVVPDLFLFCLYGFHRSLVRGPDENGGQGIPTAERVFRPPPGPLPAWQRFEPDRCRRCFRPRGAGKDHGDFLRASWAFPSWPSCSSGITPCFSS